MGDLPPEQPQCLMEVIITFSLNAGSEDSDQNRWLSWLICVSAGANVTCLVFLRLGSLFILLYVYFVVHDVIEVLMED